MPRPAAAGRAVLFLALVLLAPRLALAGAIPESQRWATITHAGNVPYDVQGPPNPFPHPPGGVDYEYQISRTETTGSEWLEFVQAYAPYVDPANAGSSSFSSQRIDAFQTSPGVWSYSLRFGGANRAVRVGWRFAARYCNWLHNDKRTDQAAFESGVYESSTFGGSPSTGGFTDQVARSEGARYFLPTIDEWVKAAYFDPNRNEPEIGGPGYWQYPNASDMQLIPGPPGVGQTSAGSTSTPEVAAYTNVQSPWGLWDLSGGQREWLETAALNPNGTVSTRFWKGTAELAGLLEQDHIQSLATGSPAGGSFGFRLARVVPSPGAALALLACSISVGLIRRRR